MKARPRIAIDAMGGDAGVEVTVPAAAAFAARADLVLVGDETSIRAALPDDAPSMAIHHASDRVLSTDSLSEVLRRKPDSSMRQALALHAAGQVDAVVSGGDTAALMALSRLLLEMVPGIERPAICKELQGMEGPFWMLDLGANLDCTPRQLHQFARMGSILARYVGGVDAPRAALLNIGTEARKGPELLHAAADLLGQDPGLNYVGFVEGSSLFAGAADVVVADGFAGNISLKSIEGAARMAGHLLRSWLDTLGPIEQAGLALVRTKLRALRHELNPQRYNGASFVGLAGVVVKSHGSADVDGFGSALEEALLEVGGQIPQRLAARFEQQV
ncbi:MAG: phosphate acyltransferase PlsX [Pseudomonadales bacterium]